MKDIIAIRVTERAYQPADLAAVARTYTDSIRSLAVPYYSPEKIEAWAPSAPDLVSWAARLAGLHTLVAESDGKVAGFASYTDAGYLDFLFTAPAFARRGVASQLLLRVEAELRRVGATKITTHARLAARPFFEHHGFSVEQEEEVECRGTLLQRFAMQRSIEADT